MDYRTLNHSKFLILFHIIFVCKYRKKLLTKLGDEIKDIFMNIAAESDFEIETMEVDQDHVHLLINSVPKLSPLSLVNRLKSLSTHRIWINNSKFLKNISGKNTLSGQTDISFQALEMLLKKPSENILNPKDNG